MIAKKIKSLLNKSILAYGIFWSWNFIFALLLIFTQVETNFLIEITRNAITGFVPLDFSIYVLLIFIIPVGCIVLGLTRFKKQPHNLLKLFYGVEIPLTIIFTLRLAVFRELTYGTTHLLLLLSIGMLSYFISLLTSNKENKVWLKYFQKIGHSFLLIIGVYVGLILIFYSIPLIAVFFKSLFSTDFFDIIKLGFWALLFSIFFLYTATVIVFSPIAMSMLYIKAFIKNNKSHLPSGKLIVLATVIFNLGLLFALNIEQPQISTFSDLEKDFNLEENRTYFHTHANEIKEGLVNAYLNKYRYISAENKNTHVYEMYHSALNCSKEFANEVQELNNVILAPFLYQGNSNKDRIKAKDLYAKYFDGSIQKNEKTEVIKAISSTWDSDGIEAGLLNINQTKVHIDKQEIIINESGDIAEIEIYEVYSNQTFERQEIFYYFSLPENAVITGLWLSDQENNPKKYAFQISPRGAAQQVYKNEVKRRVDPSLLEKIGPNQYRLRAFPILPKSHASYKSGNQIEPGEQFHLWLRYKTMITKKGNWPLPKLLERRNVYWSNNTSLIINDICQTKDDNWLPKFIPATNNISIKEHAVQLNDSLFVKITPKAAHDNSQHLSNKHIAVLIDGSYSMSHLTESILESLNSINPALNAEYFIVNNQINSISKPNLVKALTSNKNLFFATNDFLKMLHVFNQDTVSQYDAILFITDQGNYENESDKTLSISLKSPLLIHHLSGKKPPIYQDALLETLQNSGGTVIDDLSRLSLFFDPQMNANNTLTYNSDLLVEKADSIGNKNELAYIEIAAQAYINSILVTDSNRLKQLDAIHAIAKNNNIVTTYSSMIVLVNERQKEALKKAEEAKDRFDREIESGEEEVSQPSNPLSVSGTPEPHEWILIGIVILMLLYVKFGNKHLLTNKSQ
jgi:putative PEP-CTERM system integral membrane protein